MTPEQAKELLMMHSFSHDNIEHPKMQTGFMGSLRPYKGLHTENFHEVMEAVRVLAPALQQPSVDREIVSALWGICHFARAWGVHPDGMIPQNGLITPEDIERLDGWIVTISYAIAMLLEGVEEETAFEPYRDYHRKFDSGAGLR